MSQEQVTEHVFRQMEGDMWCVYCGLPKAAHRFETVEQMVKHQDAQQRRNRRSKVMTLLERLNERWEKMDGAAAIKIDRILKERREATVEIDRLTRDSEELIRGMTEMAERFTARMDAANAQIEECRECLILTVKELDTIPATTPYTKSICARARKALGLQ